MSRNIQRSRRINLSGKRVLARSQLFIDKTFLSGNKVGSQNEFEISSPHRKRIHLPTWKYNITKQYPPYQKTNEMDYPESTPEKEELSLTLPKAMM